ncbi:MAG: hypothetical protein KJ755_06305 [Alphaproteobacteria bacterium]|nr:hypothetical protein [Alphaproteobacteria bacterium]
MLLQKLTLPILGADDKTDPPWDHLSVLYNIIPHLVAAVAILSASVLPYAEGQTTKVAIVVLILVVQVGFRAWGDYAFRRRSPHETLELWLGRFVLLSLASGLAWGSALAVLIPAAVPTRRSLCSPSAVASSSRSRPVPISRPARRWCSS